MNIGFVGVGRRGANMARRLKDRGHDVTALYDVNREAARSLATELGAAACDSLAAVTAASDVVFTVVTDDAAMRAIFMGAGDNLLAGGGNLQTGGDAVAGKAAASEAAAGKVFVNCATLTPSVQLEVDQAARSAGARTLEVCMASSIPQARSGQLYLMCGGQESTFEQLKPLLQDLSTSLRYIGPTGSASKVKALVNMVMNINTAALAEGLGLGDALGLDLTVLREVFAQTGAASRVLQTDGEDMQNRDHDCYFSAAHAAKDSGIAATLGREAGLELPLAEATWLQYRKMVELGLGELDKSGIAELTFKGRQHGN